MHVQRKRNDQKMSILDIQPKSKVRYVSKQLFWRYSIFLGRYLFPWDSDCFNVQKCVFWFVGCLKLFPQPFSGFPILWFLIYLSTEMMSISEHFQVVTLRKIRQRMQWKQLSAFVMLNIAMKSWSKEWTCSFFVS